MATLVGIQKESTIQKHGRTIGEKIGSGKINKNEYKSPKCIIK